MKNVLLKYETYKDLKNQVNSLNLEKMVYKVTRELSTQHKREWLTLDNILIVVTSLLGKKITEEWVEELASAINIVSEHGYIEVKEQSIGHFTKAICVKILK